MAQSSIVSFLCQNESQVVETNEAAFEIPPQEAAAIISSPNLSSLTFIASNLQHLLIVGCAKLFDSTRINSLFSNLSNLKQLYLCGNSSLMLTEIQEIEFDSCRNRSAIL